MHYLLGIDLGSSSVKAAVVDVDSGLPVATASYPPTEAPIKALRPGWAEQRPEDWWQYTRMAIAILSENNIQLSSVQAIGVSYQMHGLVCIDRNLQPLRDAIIWCDSRGVSYGAQAPIPGNFTAAKLAWVKEHEPSLFDKIYKIMLPGDYLAMRLTGTPATTASGLSEMMLWDFANEKPSDSMMDYFGFPSSILPPLVPTFAEQGRVTSDAAQQLGIPAGIPVSYRAGDQPNNAFSLDVMLPGQFASTAGTSGVVYGILDSHHQSRVTSNPSINTFLHVNHNIGLMHCVNGCGILNSWLHRNVAPDLTYDQMNQAAASVPVGSDDLTVIPFGNGAERILLNRNIGASIHGLDFNRHGQAHLLRAAQEGIAFSLMYGMEAMTDSSSNITVIRAGRANMFLSPVFRKTLADVSGATIELYDTDGAVGAARGAGLGAGIYSSQAEAFASFTPLILIQPQSDNNCRQAYLRWKQILSKV